MVGEQAGKAGTIDVLAGTVLGIQSQKRPIAVELAVADEVKQMKAAFQQRITDLGSGDYPFEK